jgi:hypothetical protein
LDYVFAWVPLLSKYHHKPLPTNFKFFFNLDQWYYIQRGALKEICFFLGNKVVSLLKAMNRFCGARNLMSL